MALRLTRGNVIDGRSDLLGEDVRLADVTGDLWPIAVLTADIQQLINCALRVVSRLHQPRHVAKDHGLRGD